MGPSIARGASFSESLTTSRTARRAAASRSPGDPDVAGRQAWQAIIGGGVARPRAVANSVLALQQARKHPLGADHAFRLVEAPAAGNAAERVVQLVRLPEALELGDDHLGVGACAGR